MNNYKYEIQLYWNETDTTFIAEAPELAGCKSDGKTYAEALANIQIIIEEWIETAQMIGRVIPKPKGKLSFA